MAFLLSCNSNKRGQSSPSYSEDSFEDKKQAEDPTPAPSPPIDVVTPGNMTDPSGDDILNELNRHEAVEEVEAEVDDSKAVDEELKSKSADKVKESNEEGNLGVTGYSVVTIDLIREEVDNKKDIGKNQSTTVDANKVPVEGQKVKLLIRNNHPVDMWYLMPAAGKTSLNADGVFQSDDMFDKPFLGKEYKQGAGRLVELLFFGRELGSFRAFRVKANSSLLFRNYDLGNYKQGASVAFWSAERLLLNEKHKLQEWLPFDVTSTPDVTLHNTTESGVLEWNNLSENAAFKSETVKYIKAEGVKKYQIPVGIAK